MPGKKSVVKEPSRNSARARGTAPSVSPLSSPDDLWKKKKAKAVPKPKDPKPTPASTTVSKLAPISGGTSSTSEVTPTPTVASEEPVDTPQLTTPTVPSLPGIFPNSPALSVPPSVASASRLSEPTTSQMSSYTRGKLTGTNSELDGSLSDIESMDVASPESSSQPQSSEGSSSHSRELALARQQKQPEVAPTDPQTQKSVDDTLDWLKNNVSTLIQ